MKLKDIKEYGNELYEAGDLDRSLKIFRGCAKVRRELYSTLSSAMLIITVMMFYSMIFVHYGLNNWLYNIFSLSTLVATLYMSCRSFQFNLYSYWIRKKDIQGLVNVTSMEIKAEKEFNEMMYRELKKKDEQDD